MAHDARAAGSRLNSRRLLERLIPAFLLLVPLLYVGTMARTLALGDPTEYTLVANVLGIAHPPGYAVMTLLGKLFQSVVPLGAIPWRMHLLAVVAATVGAIAVYGVVRALSSFVPAGLSDSWSRLAALFAALLTALATDIWQHAIHANPHIITAAFLAVNLFLLTHWWQVQIAADEVDAPGSFMRRHRWLFAFCFSAGLGVTHHPLTLFAFPAYGLFVLLVRPTIWREWRVLAIMIGFALLGLATWLYFPIRSSMSPPFGPDSLDTLDGFLGHVLARGLSESLPFFQPADQPGRLTVFWTLLRLQYSLPAIALALIGLAWLWARRTPSLRPHFWLFAVAFLGQYLFVISLRAQDIMAYLLGPFLLVGLLAGIGFYGLLGWSRQRLGLDSRLLALLAGGLFLLGPALQVARNLPRISLTAYDEGERYVAQVFDYFAGNGEGAVLLNDWERMTPLWYTQLVEGRWPDPADVRPEFVSTDRPWVESVYQFLPGGPVYLNSYRPEIVQAGFRLRPRGPFYQVTEPGDSSIPPELTQLPAPGEMATAPRIAAYDLPEREVTAGAYVPLTLAMSAPEAATEYYAPVLTVGDPAASGLTFAFTTDSHLITPLWQPGEVIVERFDFALPHDFPPGDYPLSVRMKNLSTDSLSGEPLPLGMLTVTEGLYTVDTSRLLANFRQRVGLLSASARNGWERREAPWSEADPLPAQPGDTIHVLLEWLSLAPAEESYTVFVHLIDPANVPYAALDYTPLGGSTPTHLWFPKWLPNQAMLDPYRLVLDPNLPPGLYYIEVGLYEMIGGRRLHISDATGHVSADRIILGPVLVTAPETRD